MISLGLTTVAFAAIIPENVDESIHRTPED
jgi:hypothetical protein